MDRYETLSGDEPKAKRTVEQASSRRGATSEMGGCLCCLQDRDGDRDPILDAQARARAAEAAQMRHDDYSKSAVRKREAKMRAKESSPSKGGLSNESHQQRINDIIS